MTRRITLPLWVGLALVAGCVRSAPGSTPTGTPGARPDPAGWTARAWDDRSAFRGGLIPEAQAALDDRLDATVYQVDLRLSDDLTLVEGRQDVRYTNTESVPLTEVYLRLFPNLLGSSMRVGQVTADKLAVEPAYTLQSSATATCLRCRRRCNLGRI